MTQHTRLAASIAALLLTAATANAASNRVWVSGHGTDSAGCGAPAAPCRSLQYALDNAVVAGGEIDILDPAGYGAMTISHSVSVVNDGVGTAGVQTTSGNAVVITAGANDTVYLKGLNIDGVQGAGFKGVRFATGARLTMVGCVVRHFADNGIQVEQATGNTSVDIIDTLSSDNGGSGFAYLPLSGTGITDIKLDRLTADGNQDGIDIDARDITGSVSVIANQVRADQNGSLGLDVQGAANPNLFYETDLSDYSQNAGVGLTARGAANIFLSRSVLSGNSVKAIDSALTGGALRTFSNNTIIGPVTGTLTPVSPQ